MLSKLREYVKYIVPFVLGVFLFSLITDFENTMNFLSSVWGWLMYICSRFIIGLCIAYILNFFVRWLRKTCRFPKWLAIGTAYAVLIGIVVWMVVYLVPYLSESVRQILDFVPTATRSVEEFIDRYFARMDEGTLDFINSFVSNVLNQFSSWGDSVFDITALLPALSAVGRVLLNISFGLLISFYVLVNKSKLLLGARRVMFAFMKKEKAETRIQFCREANDIFSHYVVGKFIDSLIIGVLSAILYAIFGLEMMPFLAFIAFLFNMIPYLGPVIGTVITTLILLFFSPLHALYGLIICIVLQTLDGSFIGPKILGDSVGISPLLTIVAISIGGDIGGILGIFVGVPIMATLKTLVFDRIVQRNLEKKNIQVE